jgi:hypothetical protein
MGSEGTRAHFVQERRTHDRPTGRHARPLTRGQQWRLGLTGGDPSRPKIRWERWFSGPTGWLRILALVAIGLGFGSLPFDWADERRALALESSGRTVTVSEVRVHVGHRFARYGGDWDEVDRVQVRIPGVADGSWVDVYGLNNLEMNPDVEGSLWRRGWQAPTGATTYRPPLEVVYRVGRNVDVMTPGDIARWTTSDDVEISAGIGASGVGLLALTLVLPTAWRRLEVYRRR